MTTTTLAKHFTFPKISTENLLRITVMFYWFIAGIQMMISTEPYVASQHLLPWYLETVVYLGFGPAFWLNTRNITVQTLNWQSVALLCIQAITAFSTNINLIYVVAAEIPLVLPTHAAVNWVMAQNIPITAWIFWIDQTRSEFMHYPNLPQLPHALIVLLGFMEIYAFHAFAFLMGQMIAAEARGRREAERLNAELLATQDLLAQSSRLAERTYVARELHDALGHHLVALKVNLELAQHLVTEVAAKTPLADALALVKRLLSEVREVVSGVRSQPKMDLRQTIQTLLIGVSELKVELIFPDNLTVADPAHTHVLFRCVQEAVTNTLKHARAQRLKIAFSKDQRGVTLVLQDDGKGTTLLHTGLGLKGMRERLESVGGTLAIDTSSKGFTLTAHIPRATRLMP